MGAGAIVISALKAVGTWVLNNPNIALDAVDKVAKIQQEKKSISYDEQLQIADDRINQLGAAALELEEKIDSEVGQLRNELENVQKQMQAMKNMLCIMGAVVGASIIAIVLLAIF
jgi:hypothetical protein